MQAFFAGIDVSGSKGKRNWKNLRKDKISTIILYYQNVPPG